MITKFINSRSEIRFRGVMDRKDLEIIKILEKNARTPFLKIAKKLRMSEAAIRKRVRKLEQEGVVERYTAVINPSKLGYNAVAIVGLDAEPERYLEILNSISAIPEVKKVVTSTGDHMIMTEVWARDNGELTRIITRKIGKVKGVKKICPAIVLERIK